MKTPTQYKLIKRIERYVLRFVFCLFLAACTLPAAVKAPPTLVIVTADPNALPTPTPFQPIGDSLAPLDPVTPIPTFTPLPPTDTPLPTLEFTATVLAPPTASPISARTQYTLYVLLDYTDHLMATL